MHIKLYTIHMAFYEAYAILKRCHFYRQHSILPFIGSIIQLLEDNAYCQLQYSSSAAEHISKIICFIFLELNCGALTPFQMMVASYTYPNEQVFNIAKTLFNLKKGFLKMSLY